MTVVCLDLTCDHPACVALDAATGADYDARMQRVAAYLAGEPVEADPGLYDDLPEPPEAAAPAPGRGRSVRLDSPAARDLFGSR